MNTIHKWVGLALAMAAPLSALAATQDAEREIAALHAELTALRAAQTAQIQALENRLKAAETALGVTPQSPPSIAVDAGVGADAAATIGAPVTLPPPAPPSAMAPPAPAATASGNAFNPSLSLILSGGYLRTAKDPTTWHLPGFALPPDTEAGPGTRGLNLAESELRLEASIDPWLRGATSVALHPDNTVSVEEAFAQTTALSNGLRVKAGRFLSGIGYLNEQHAHVWDFADAPLAYQAFLGSQYGDDGVQIRWVAPTDTFVELGAELGRGRSYPGNGIAQNGAGMRALYGHVGDDVGDSSSWRAGVSWLSAQARNQELLTTDSTGQSVRNGFSGTTSVWVADAVWKWAPGGNATRTNFKLQGEYLRSTREGQWSQDLDSTALTDAYRIAQSGWYVQGVWQFMPRWRLGLRTERLDPGVAAAGVNTAALAGTGYHPSRQALMLDFSPSEFSRVRLQLALDRVRQGVTDPQLQLQYQMSLGAHGAHIY